MKWKRGREREGKRGEVSVSWKCWRKGFRKRGKICLPMYDSVNDLKPMMRRTSQIQYYFFQKEK